MSNEDKDGLTAALESYFEPIGRLVVRFSHLEAMVLTFAISITKADPSVTLALFAEMSFSKRLDALSSIAPLKITDKALCDELHAVIAALSKAEDRRNTILHTLWTASPSGRLFRMKPTAKRRKGLQTNLRDASLEHIGAATREIEEAMNRLSELTKELKKGGLMQIQLFT